MSITILNQVYDETRRLAIAGSNLANNDFRLEKLIAPLEQGGAKAPIFARVAQAIEKVITAPSETAAESLLELSSLVSAVLYTQGETGLNGDIQAIETQDLELPASATTARVLKPIIEALTTTGSGRFEIIRDAHQRGAFKDLRLVRLAVAAIDDVYSEIGDFVAEHVLPTYGIAVYSELLEGINIKGRAGHIRRLRVMHRLDKDSTHGLVEDALENGSVEMKVAALECLKGSQDHIPYLLGQTTAKSKEVKRAAFEAIAELTDKEVLKTFETSLGGSDIDLAVGAISRNRSARLLSFVLQEAEQQLGQLYTTQSQAKVKSQLRRLHSMLDCFRSRTDKKTGEFLLTCFRRKDELHKLKGPVSGKDVVLRTARLFVENNLKAGQELLVQSHESLDPELFALSMIAAFQTRKPRDVYQMYSSYYLAVPKSKKSRSGSKRELIRDTILSLAQGQYAQFYSVSFSAQGVQLDPGWLDAAVETEDLDLVLPLARPRHKATFSFLTKVMQAGLTKKSGPDVYELANVLETMNRVKHPEVTEYFTNTLAHSCSNKSHRHYYSYWLLRLIPDLPKKAVPKLEALLPNLHERMIDEVIPYLEQLKAK